MNENETCISCLHSSEVTKKDTIFCVRYPPRVMDEGPPALPEIVVPLEFRCGEFAPKEKPPTAETRQTKVIAAAPKTAK